MTSVNRDARNRALSHSRDRRPRYILLDVLRGLCVVSMVLYHGMYDLVAIKGYPVSWFFDTPGYLWQQSICWTFILLSGLCWRLGRRHTQRGILLVACGAIVTVVTWLVMPSELILYGILTLLGLSCLLVNVFQLLFEKLDWKIPPAVGLGVSLGLFLLLRDVPQGFLGFEGLRLLELPAGLYQFPALAGLGFPPAAFHSSDYFPLIPWAFLYLAGYFLWGILEKHPGILGFLRGARHTETPPLLRPFAFLGRHSLLIYLLHQPVLMLIFLAVPARA